MSLGLIEYKWKYRMWHWNKDEWVEETSFERTYHAAAEDFARDYDNESAMYPDERVIELLSLSSGHDTPRTFRVFSETVRQYSAREIEFLPDHEKERE